MKIMDYEMCKVYIDKYVETRSLLYEFTEEKIGLTVGKIIYSYSGLIRIDNWQKANHFSTKPKECGNCKHRIKNKGYIDYCGSYKDELKIFVYNDCSCDRHEYKEKIWKN